jgi:hypothetical protein
MKYNISSKLLEEYNNSIYKILNPEIQIHLDELNPEIDNLLFSKQAVSWGFLTAYNPFSLLQEEAINQRQNNKLKRFLLLNQYTFFESIGFNKKGEFPPEKNFFILDIPFDYLNKLALYFKQNAFLFGKISEKAKLIFTEETT